MVGPILQLALDLTDSDKALEIAKKTQNDVDIIEIGTVLAIEAGLKSVRDIKAAVSNVQILADIRIIKAGGKLAKMAYEAGADIVTIISDATNETFEAVVAEKNKAVNRDVMIEINTSYTDEQLNYWKSLGLQHIIFHRGSEIVASHNGWEQAHFDEIVRLSELGFKVYATGGIGLKEISHFYGVPVYGFIIGRTISNAEDPSQEAQKYKNEIAKWVED